MVLGQEIVEPTLPALVLAVAGIAVFVVVCVVAMAGLPAWGYLGWTFAAVAVVLAGLLVGLWRKPQTMAAPSTGRQWWFRRICVVTRWLFIALLTSWLGLIAWLALGPGGPEPAPNANPNVIRVITWNIHCGQSEGPPWKQFDWPARKEPLRAALEQARPDILCVQEATGEQVAFLQTALPQHCHVGIGRDGAAGGERCAIFFTPQRFMDLGGDTFWLEEPTDQPRAGSALDVKRICTWVQLHDRVSSQSFKVFNTHQYLTEEQRLAAARLILAQFNGGDPILLTADFNAGPSAPSRTLFLEAGFVDSAVKIGKRAGEPTFQLYGIGLWSIDGILVSHHWGVVDYQVLKVKPQNMYPSDHFGVLADLLLLRGPPPAPVWRDGGPVP
jgi:endonuclease/exonuclease/phosphatase family metal-dependent hydrolase